MLPILTPLPTFDPRQISLFGLWLDGKDPAGNGIIPSIGTSLANWVDRVTGQNYAQGTAASRPTFQNNGILFDGTDDYFENATNLVLPSTFTIISALGDPVSNGTALGHSTQNCKFTAAGVSENIFIRVLNGGSSDSANMFPAASSITTFTRDSSNKVDLKINNGNSLRLFSDAAQAGNMTINRVGRDDAANYWDGLIKEILIYYKALTTAEITQVNQYLSQKWSIAI